MGTLERTETLAHRIGSNGGSPSRRSAAHYEFAASKRGSSPDVYVSNSRGDQAAAERALELAGHRGPRPGRSRRNTRAAPVTAWLLFGGARVRADVAGGSAVGHQSQYEDD